MSNRGRFLVGDRTTYTPFGTRSIIARHPDGHCFLSATERDFKANETNARSAVEFIARMHDRGLELRHLRSRSRAPTHEDPRDHQATT